MITLNGTQARVFCKHELLYSTLDCRNIHRITEDFYVIEEEKALTAVYCSTLIMRLDNLLLYKILSDVGLLVYENIMNQCLGTFYTKTMNRLAWFLQEEEHLIFMPQGKANILLRGYIVLGFSEDGELILEDQKGRSGCWSAKKMSFVPEIKPIFFNFN